MSSLLLGLVRGVLGVAIAGLIVRLLLWLFAEVRLRTPGEALFVGSHAKVRVLIPGIARLSFDEMEFVVPAGPEGGQISLSRDADFDPAAPELMLLAGYRPGDYTLQARRRSDGRVIAESRFRVTDRWTDRRFGPSRWFSGEPREERAGSAWGGGPAGVQNTDVNPATGTRRLAILFVDTSSQRYPGDTTALRDRWLDEAVRGVMIDAKIHSTAAYFREVSYGNFDLSAAAFGPVSLPGDWDEYFVLDEENGIWLPRPNFWQSAITAADDLIDYNTFESIVFVSRSVDAAEEVPRRFAWPYASMSSWGPYSTAEGDRRLGVISMPHDWSGIHATLMHEVGHNLGIGDQYAPSVPMPNPPPGTRNIGQWDPMHDGGPLPHFALVHRLWLGWARADWVEPINFLSLGTTVDRTLQLSPIARGAPAEERRAGVEVRLADGWNYYLEYRKAQPEQIGDQRLPTDGAVLLSELVSPPHESPIARPALLRVPNDEDGDGSVLGSGQDYRETDFTDPSFPANFRVDVVSANEDAAEVRIRYGVVGRPDPSIRPWPAGPERPWQSPDIEVRNERSREDPEWFNVPWNGRDNTVVARVRNAGDLDAAAVRVNFYVKDFTVTGAPETLIGSDVRDVPAGETVEFEARWRPSREGHFCIVVRIPLYQTPGPVSVVEMTELNNVAQSNYSRFISREASPGSREQAFITVENPYEQPTHIILVGAQTNPFYRTYLEHAWLYLEAGERRRVRVMFEYADEPSFDVRQSQRNLQELPHLPNRATVVAHIEDPRASPRHPVHIFNGVEAQIVRGLATRIVGFAADQQQGSGSVVLQRDGTPVSGGKVILIATRPVGGETREEYRVLPVRSGRFAGPVPPGWRTLEAYYLPPPGLADTTSEALESVRR